MRFSRLFAVAGIALLLSACASLTGTADQPLQQTHWKLSSLADSSQLAHESQRTPDLQFNSRAKRVAGSTGCNRFMGSYTLKGQQLKFRQLATTMMACSRGMDTEEAYLDALSKVASWKVHGDSLELLDANKQPLAHFEASKK